MRRLEAETCQLVSLKVQNFQSFESFKRVRGDPAQLVPLKMKVTQGREAGELPVEELLQLVALQVEHFRPGQAFQAERSDRDDVAVVQENLDDMTSSNEARSYQLSHVISIKVDLSGVHGDERGHVCVVAGRALDLVRRPLRVVEAGAVVGALHAAVASEEVAAEAVWLAVR